MTFRIALTTLLLLLVATGKLAWAGTLEDAEEAERKSNYSLALKLYTSLAEQKAAPAQLALGLLYLKGNGVEVNVDEALNWFWLAGGNPTASSTVHDDAINYFNSTWFKMGRPVSVPMMMRVPDADRKLGLAWNFTIDESLTSDEREKLHATALRTVREDPKCGRIFGGGKSQYSSEKYFISCTGQTERDRAYNVRFN